MNSNIKEVLKALEEGKIKAEEALERLKIEPFEDIGYAKLDLHRRVRQGSAEGLMRKRPRLSLSTTK